MRFFTERNCRMILEFATSHGSKTVDKTAPSGLTG